MTAYQTKWLPLLERYLIDQKILTLQPSKELGYIDYTTEYFGDKHIFTIPESTLKLYK